VLWFTHLPDGGGLAITTLMERNYGRLREFRKRMIRDFLKLLP